MTWDELLNLSKQVTRSYNGTQYAGFATSVTHSMRMNSTSLKIVDKKTEQAAIDNDKWKQTLKKGTLFTNDFVKEQNLAILAMNFGLQ